MDNIRPTTMDNLLVHYRRFAEQLHVPPAVSHSMSTANSSTNAVKPFTSTPECDDDVILIEPEIPFIDLCSPAVTRQPSRPLEDVSKQTNRINKLSNNNRLIVNAVVEKQPLVMCKICLNSVIGSKPHATHCGHVFCEYCIRRSMNSKKQCPTCKKFINSTIPLFF